MTVSSVAKRGIVFLVGILAMAAPSQAALVSGIYAGTISDDDGLGLLGQTLTVDFTYDDTTPASFGSTYDNLLTNLTVSIGTDVWTWNTSGYSSVSLANNQVILFSVGQEDRMTLSAYEFSGPSPAPDVEESSYSLDIYLNDDTPDGDPDGLSSENLPSVVPDPGLFQYTQFERPLIVFSFISGDAELGTFYQIQANDVRLVPEPATLSLLSLGGLLLLRRPRNCTRRS